MLDDIGFKTRIDLAGWDFGLRKADTTLDSFTRRAATRLEDLPSPKLTTPDIELGSVTGKAATDSTDQFAAMGNQIERMGVTFGSMSGEIGQALKKSVGPLQSFAHQFNTNFNEVGATIELLAIRIDDAMRFSEWERRVKGFITGLSKRAGLAAKEVKTAVAPAGDGIANAFGFNPTTTAKVDTYLDRMKSAVAGKAKAIGTDLGKGIGYGLDAAVHYMPDPSILTRGYRSRNAKGRFTPGPAHNPATTAPRQQRSAAFNAPSTAAWEGLKKVATATFKAEAAGWNLMHGFFRRDVKDINHSIGAWLNLQRVANFLTSIGSVAKATFAKLHGKKLPPLVDPKQSIAVRQLGNAASAASGHFKQFGDSVAGALGLFGMTYKAVDFLKSGVAEAANLNETLSKTDAVLGKSSPAIKAYSDELADMFGLAKRETLDMSSGFAGIFKGLGKMSGNDLTDATKQFTTLAADLSSFGNTSFDQAGTALRAALTGNESDFLKQLGVIYNEDAMEIYSFSHALNKSTEDMTEQEKVMVRMGLIMDATGDAQGDLGKTADSTSNMWRNLTGTLTNFGAEIGTMMLPAVDQGLKGLLGVVGTLKTAFLDSKAVVKEWFDKIAKGFDMMAAIVTHPAAAFEVLRLYAIQALTNIAEWILVIPDNFRLMYDYMSKNGKQLFTDLAINALTATENIADNFLKLGKAIGTFLSDPMKGFPAVDWTPLTQGFLHTAEKLPKLIRPVLTDLSKEITAAKQPIVDDYNQRREAAKAEKPFSEAKGDALSGANEQPDKKKKKKKEEQFTAALELGSKEAYSAFVSAAYGGPSGKSEVEKTGKEQLAAIRKGNAIQGQIARALVGKAPQISFP